MELKFVESVCGKYYGCTPYNDCASLLVVDDVRAFLFSLNIKGKNAIDGGSNIGATALVLSEIVGDGKVYAYEIQPVINDLAIKNAKINRKDNIIFHNKALSDVSGSKVGFTYINYDQPGASSVGVKTEYGLKGQPHCGEIETIAIDDTDIDNVGVIKLDLEGHEPQALNGMWKLIERCRPYLLIELSETYLKHAVKTTIDSIVSRGYDMEMLSDHNYIFRAK